MAKKVNKKAKKKVRTTAQRRAAAKAAWATRRLRGANKPTSVRKGHVTPPPIGIDFGRDPSIVQPTTAAATREDSELYVTVSSGGSVHRHQLSRDTMRKLGLDCLQLVG